MDFSAQGLGRGAAALVTGAGNAIANAYNAPNAGLPAFLQTQSLQDGVRDFARGAGVSAPAPAPARFASLVAPPAAAAAPVAVAVPQRGDPNYDAASQAVDAFMQKHGSIAGKTTKQLAAMMGPLSPQAAPQLVLPVGEAPATGATGFGGVIQQFANQAGGVSLNQLAALSDAYAKTTKAQPKVQTAADKAIGAAGEFLDNYYGSQREAHKGDMTATQKVLEAEKNDRLTLAAHASQVNSAVGADLAGSGS